MTDLTTKIRRASIIAPFVVVALAGTAWAGCPPVDMNNCQLLHENWEACHAAKDALGALHT